MAIHHLAVKELIRLFHPPHHVNSRTPVLEEVMLDRLCSAQASEVHKKILQK